MQPPAFRTVARQWPICLRHYIPRESEAEWEANRPVQRRRLVGAVDGQTPAPMPKPHPEGSRTPGSFSDPFRVPTPLAGYQRPVRPLQTPHRPQLQGVPAEDEAGGPAPRTSRPLQRLCLDDVDDIRHAENQEQGRCFQPILVGDTSTTPEDALWRGAIRRTAVSCATSQARTRRTPDSEAYIGQLDVSTSRGLDVGTDGRSLKLACILVFQERLTVANTDVGQSLADHADRVKRRDVLHRSRQEHVWLQSSHCSLNDSDDHVPATTCGNLGGNWFRTPVTVGSLICPPFPHVHANERTPYGDGVRRPVAGGSR